MILHLIGICQTVFRIEGKTKNPDLKIAVSQILENPDLKIKLNYGNVANCDLFFAITKDREKADIIISNNFLDSIHYNIEKTRSANFADISIELSANVKNPDFIVAYKEFGSVNLLIYTEKQGLPFDDWVITLLPFLNKLSNGKNKLLSTHFSND